MRGEDHPLNAALAKAAGDDHAVELTEFFTYIFRRDCFGIDPFNQNLSVLIISRMAQGFRDGKISVVQLHIFADKTDFYLLFAVFDPLHHMLPIREVGLAAIKL